MSFEIDPSLPVRSKTLPKTLVPVPVIDRAKVARTRQFQLNDMMMGADSDEAGHAFQSEAGRYSELKPARYSDAKPATWGVARAGRLG